MKFCPVCRYYMPLKQNEDKLMNICTICGHKEENNGGLVMSENLQEKSSEGYKLLDNEFLLLDPTLPHVDTLKCPNGECPANKGAKKSDVIYIKYDAEKLKFLYVCTNCETRWRSK